MFFLHTALLASLGCAQVRHVNWRGETRLVDRCEGERAVVDFDPAGLDAPAREEFAALVERGIADLQGLLAASLPAPLPGPRIRFVVSERIGISQTHGRTVLLPLGRVQARRAPYLHETVHALIPTRHRSAWLSEGLACYLESWVAEHVGGYDAQVFTRGGDGGVHTDAGRHLASSAGRAVLPWVGASGQPPGLSQDRARVARPFYVLSHSFTKHLVEALGLAPVAGLASGADPEARLQRLSGRRMGDWRAEWLRRCTGGDVASAGWAGRLSSRRGETTKGNTGRRPAGASASP